MGVHAAKFSTEKEADSVSRAIDRHQIRHPVVLDPTHDLWDRYAIRSWPTLVVLDVQGRIAWQQSGEVNRAALRAVIQGLLDEAREAGTLGEAAWSRPSPAAHTGLLRHPGKVSVHPPPIAQAAEDADPFGADSRLYVADTGHHRILELVLVREGGDWPKARLLRTFGDGQPGLVDGAPEAARFRMPQGMTRTEDTLWVADTDNHAIRAIDLNSGTVTTMAGTGHRGEGIDLSARDPKQIALRSPWDVDAATDNDGAAIVLIAMAGTHQIWIFFPERGQIGPFIGSGVEEHVDGPPDQAALAQPSGMVLAGHYLFFVDSETSSVRAYRMDERHLGTLAGQGLFDFGDIDGKGDAVRLQHPLGITLGIQELYIADTFNHKIKTLRMRDGQVTTLAGGDPQTLSEPGGLDRAGDFLIIADTNNHRLRIAHRETGEIRDLEVDWG
ncbi:MAG: alkyl hydroperoxide reductase [Myxococcota bacterium]